VDLFDFEFLAFNYLFSFLLLFSIRKASRTLSFSLGCLLAFFDLLCQTLSFFVKILFDIYVRVFQEVQVKIYGHKLSRVFYLNLLSYLKIFIAAMAFLVLKG
jgi:hypothetical protein